MFRPAVPTEDQTSMPDHLPHDRDDRRHSPIFVPSLPLVLHRRPWYRRHSLGTMIGAALLIIAIGASFVYAFRIEAEREEAAAHRTP